jgi:membrane fusion protein, multidrug efflux system
MTKQKLLSALLIFMLAWVTACSKVDDGDSKNAKKDAKATLVTVTKVVNAPVENTQETLGTIEGLIDPTIAAEVAAKVIKVYVGIGDQVSKGQLLATLDATDFAMQRNEAAAEVARIQALLSNQIKVVERNRALVNKNFISENALDNELAQQNALKQQLTAAKARVGSINHSSSKSKIISPVTGVVEKKLVDTGDYVRVGDPILQIISKQKLRAHLPFPEQVGAQLKPGLTVRLTTPSSLQSVETVIKELKPLITEGNRTIDVIADVNGTEGWQPGASVKAVVVLNAAPAALMIPEQSLVLRPAGEVVYIVKNNTAHQAVIKTGLKQGGLIEVISGLSENDTVVVDGAGFLTDKAPIKISHANEKI